MIPLKWSRAILGVRWVTSLKSIFFSSFETLQLDYIFVGGGVLHLDSLQQLGDCVDTTFGLCQHPTGTRNGDISHSKVAFSIRLLLRIELAPTDQIDA